MARRYRSFGLFDDNRYTGPVLKDLNNLSLSDLKNLRKRIVNYPAKITEIEAYNAAVAKGNELLEKERSKVEDSYQQKYNNWYRANVQAHEERSSTLRKWFFDNSQGFLSSLIGATITVPDFTRNGLRVAKEPGEKFYAEYKELQERIRHIKKTAPQRPDMQNLRDRPLKRMPSDWTDLIIGGVKLRAYFRDFAIADIDHHIAQKQAIEDKRKEEVQTLRARAATSEKATRSLAKNFLRNGLKEQLKKLPICPYCGTDLGNFDPHQDHIHPVSKGGQSSPRNLVFVCSPCNLKKKNNTLGIFIKKYGLDIAYVHRNLDVLGKDY